MVDEINTMKGPVKVYNLKTMTRAEKLEMAREFEASGKSYHDLAKDSGVTEGSIGYWLNQLKVSRGETEEWSKKRRKKTSQRERVQQMMTSPDPDADEREAEVMLAHVDALSVENEHLRRIVTSLQKVIALLGAQLED